MSFIKSAIRLLCEEAARIYILPVAVTIGVGVMGWSQDIPRFYVCVGVGLLFASISTGLLRFDEWRYQKRVVDKLAFSMVRATGGVKSIGLGFTVHNTARFPIQFRVAELNTKFMKSYPLKKNMS